MANSDKNIRITTSKNKTTYPNIVFTGSAAGSSVITLEVLDDNTLSFTSNEGQVFSIDSNLSSGTIWAVSDISGVPLLSSSAGGTVGLAVYGGIVGIGQTNPIYKLDLKGSFGLASSNDNLYNFIFSNSAASGSNSLSIRSANSLLLYNSGNTFYTGFKSRASADKLYLLPATDGSSGQFLQTDGASNLSWATATGGGGGSGATGVNPGGQYQVGYYASTGASIDGSSTFTNNTATGIVAIGHATVSTSIGSGALTVSGGVGIGGSLYVGGTGSSISGVRIASGAITAGAWNGTVIGVQYGGTGQNLTGLSGILTISGGTVSNSTTSSAISSALSDETGSGSLVFGTQPSFGTGVTTGDATFAVFNTNATTINAFGAATTISLGASTGTATFNSTNNTTAANTGAVVFSGGVGIGRSVSIGGRLLLFNGSTYTGFLSSQVGTGNTVYTLPSSSPATGTSVLQSTSEGVMSWVPMVASGGAGSGTVAIPDAQFRLAFYAGTGASVSSTNLIVAVGTGVTILGATNASSTTTAAFSILGGLGVTGNAFIGGTTTIQNTQATTSSSTGALVIIGGAAVGQTLSVGGSLNIFNAANYTGFRFAGSANTTYTLPPRTPTGTATSYLSSSIDGVMAWVAAPTSGGSGSVSSGTATYAAFYPSTTNSVSENANLQFTGTGVSVGGLIQSTSTTSGSLYVSGGLGITGNAFIGGTTYIPSTTPSNISNLLISNNISSTSTGSGALVISGGLGIAGNAFIGGTFVHQSTTSSVGTNSGSVTLAGGMGIAGNAFIGGTFVHQSTTSSVGTNSGSVTLAGGIGIAGNAFIGGTVVQTNSTSSVGTNSGAITVAGGMGLAGNAFIGGTTTITSTTASVSSDSGALVIRGGVGIGESVSVGGSLNIFNGANYSGFRFAGSANTTYTLPPRTPTGTATSYLSSSIDGVMAWVAAPTSGGSGSVNSGTATFAAFYASTTNSVSENANLQFTGTGVSIGGRINSTSTTSGSVYVYGGIGITGNAFIGGTAYIPSTTPSNISNLLVSNNTATTTTTSGALVVSGGLGLAGNAFIGSTVYVPSTTASNFSNLLVSNNTATTTTTSGALVVSGGLGLAGNAFIGGTVYVPSSTASNFSNLLVSNNTASTSTSSGALVVNGGLGIAGNAFIGGTFVQQNSTSSVGTNSGSMSIAGGVGIAGNAFIGGTFVQQNNTSSVGINSGAITVAGGVGIAGNAFIGGTTTITSTTASVGSDSGALVVRGGVGIGLSVSVGGSLNIFNGANYTGFRFAGSANTTYTLPPRTPTGTGTSYLSSGIDGVMAWVAAPTSGGSGSINSSVAGKVAFYSGATTISGETTNTFDYTSATGRFLIANPDTEAVPNPSTLFLGIGTGTTNFSATGFRKTLAAFITNNAWTDGDLLVLGVAGAGTTQKFAVDWRGFTQIGVPGTGFTLPVTNGSSGQVLTANTNGVASWTTVSGSSGAGSGTVAIPGAQYQVAAYYHSATGASVSGSSTFTNNTATGVARITHTTESTSTSTGALVVDGGAGIAKSLYVGTTLAVGGAPGYNIPNNLASFTSTVNSYNQLVIANRSNGTSASSNLVVNNDQSTDAIFYGEIGMNSSTFSGTGALGAPNAVYLASASAPLVLGTTTAHPIRLVVNGSATDTIYIHEAGTAISVFTNLDLRSQNDIRFFNSGNTFNTGLQAGANTVNYTLSLPTAPVGAGASVIVTGSDGQMYYAAPGGGIAFSSAIANTPLIRARRPLNLQFCSGFTPAAAGADTAIIRVPESATDGTSVLTYNLRRFQVRIETPSAGSSRLQLERSSTDTGAFTLAAAGSSHIGGFGVTLTGAGTFLTSVTTFAGAFVTSGNLLRLNWTLLNATHANFSINLILEEV